ncbi:MAG: flagellar motor protein MotB [Hyphomicrobiales bacterium]|nr:MAG: flagellar motor protein MotB [Hyphomicrobiales bacterium]
MRMKFSGLIAAITWLALGIGAAWAEPIVTLTSLDGATRVEGEMLGFDGRKYTLRTGVGIISVAADQVTCSGEGCPVGSADRGQLTIVGSNIIGDGLMPSLIEGYADTRNAEMVREVGARENEHVFRLVDDGGNEVAAINVRAHNTAAAFSALADGTAAIGLASRRVNEAEAGLTGLRDSPNEHILALDGLIVIVNPDNPVRSLTLDQIAAVFAGQTTNWAELGGPDQPISLYVPNEDSGTLDVFETLVMQPRALAIAESAERLEDHADLSDLVSIDPSAIGVTGFAYARGSRMLAIRQQCGLVSLPTAFSIKTEEYPLGRRLYAYGSDTDGQAVLARALLDFALSDAAQPIIAETGFIDRDIEGQGIEVQGARLANSLTSPEEFSLPLFREMLTELKDAERLSITFRFTLGSSNLEVRSQSEAERFARLLAGGAYAGKDIILVGFTDSVGELNVNRGLALRRAQSVLDTLKAAVGAGALDTVPILAQSYGELTPVGCNETNEGRELNRRVEVWVRDKRG